MNKRGFSSKISCRIYVGDEVALGPGKADLLEHIHATGSISAAGRAMGMSYKRAWSLVETMNRCFRTPLVTTSKGGSAKGGAALTDAGVEVLARYRELQAAAIDAANPHLTSLRTHLAEGRRPV